MFNEHLILKAFGHIIWNWHLIVWLLGQFLVMWVFKSINSQSPFRISINIYPKSISRVSSIKICSNLKICWIFLETSEVSDISSEVSKFLRKFQKFFGSPGHSVEVSDFLRKFRIFCGSFILSSEVPDFEFFQVIFSIPLRPSSLQKHISQLPAPSSLSLPCSPLSKSQNSSSNLQKFRKSSEVWIQGLQIILIAFPRASHQGIKVFSCFALMEFFPRSLSYVQSSQIPSIGLFMCLSWTYTQVLRDCLWLKLEIWRFLET